MSEDERTGWLDAVLGSLFEGAKAPEEWATFTSFASQVRAERTTLGAHPSPRVAPPSAMAMSILVDTLRRTFGAGTLPEQIIDQLGAADANLLVTAFTHIPRTTGSKEERAYAMLMLCSTLVHPIAWPAGQLLSAQLKCPDVLGWSGMALLFAYCDSASLGRALGRVLLVADSRIRSQLISFLVAITAAVPSRMKDLVSHADLKKALDTDMQRIPRGVGKPVKNYFNPSSVAGVAQSGKRRTTGNGSPRSEMTRFLQQQAYRLEREAVPARGGFRENSPCAVDIRVGPADKEWDSLRHAFPDHLLPTSGLSTLTVWLSEPRHIPNGVHGSLEIGPRGPSSTCRLSFVSGSAGEFDGRLSLLHNGRVLQTARLKGKVLSANDRPSRDGTPHLEEQVAVSQFLSGLDVCKGFDLAVVMNRGNQDEGRAAVYRGEQAQITALTTAAAIGKQINDALSEAASTAADMVDGIDSPAGSALLVFLARLGHMLGMHLFGHGFERRDQAGILKSHRIQIVDARSDGILPLEFVYDYPSPSLKATPCPNWRTAVQAGDCPSTCPLAISDHSAEHVCPMGFWGLSKVIERHKFDQTLVTPGRATLLAEHSPASGKIKLCGDVVMAFSSRVAAEPRKQVEDVFGKYNLVKARTVTSWDEWKAVVSTTNPPLIVGIVHADSDGMVPTLEIEGTPLAIVDLTHGHITSGAECAIAPVVLLIGCDIAQAHAAYGSYVLTFRLRGASVVVATISTLYPRQAAAAASRLADTLFGGPDGSTTIGEALRNTRQQAVLHGELLSLSLLAYGDADWELETGE